MNNSTPRILRAVKERATAATWHAWGRKDERWDVGSADLADVDVFEFADFAAGEAREYHDPNHERSHLGSIQDQWTDFLQDRQIT